MMRSARVKPQSAHSAEEYHPRVIPQVETNEPRMVPPLEVDDEMEDLEDDVSTGDQYHIGRRARTLFRTPRGDDDTINSTRSLYDTDVVYIDIHGRRYCGDYFMPNDEEEQTRQEMLHIIYLHLFGHCLTTVPLQNPQKILDIGCGTGEWTMAIGEQFPNAEVIGTDIAKIQASAPPPNVFFEIDDAEEEGGWMYNEEEFDMVHFRSMGGAFTDWNHIYSEAYKHLKPGGWIEVLDFDDHKSLLGYFTEESGVLPWMRSIREALEKSGRPRSIDHLEAPALTSLGFVDVKTSAYDLPIGTWPEDPEEQKVAKLFLVAQLCGIEALCLRPLTEQLGWDINEVRRACDKVTDAIRAVATDPERARGISFTVKVIVGRKPGGPEICPSRRGRGYLAPEEQDDDGESVNTMTNTNGQTVNGQTVNGQTVNGQTVNGQTVNGN